MRSTRGARRRADRAAQHVCSTVRGAPPAAPPAPGERRGCAEPRAGERGSSSSCARRLGAPRRAAMRRAAPRGGGGGAHRVGGHEAGHAQRVLVQVVAVKVERHLGAGHPPLHVHRDLRSERAHAAGCAAAWAGGRRRGRVCNTLGSARRARVVVCVRGACTWTWTRRVRARVYVRACSMWTVSSKGLYPCISWCYTGDTLLITFQPLRVV